jgi:hypothetical protein
MLLAAAACMCTMACHLYSYISISPVRHQQPPGSAQESLTTAPAGYVTPPASCLDVAPPPPLEWPCEEVIEVPNAHQYFPCASPAIDLVVCVVNDPAKLANQTVLHSTFDDALLPVSLNDGQVVHCCCLLSAVGCLVKSSAGCASVAGYVQGGSGAQYGDVPCVQRGD